MNSTTLGIHFQPLVNYIPHFLPIKIMRKKFPKLCQISHITIFLDFQMSKTPLAIRDSFKNKNYGFMINKNQIKIYAIQNTFFKKGMPI
jgi:hypothetical protein